MEKEEMIAAIYAVVESGRLYGRTIETDWDGGRVIWNIGLCDGRIRFDYRYAFAGRELTNQRLETKIDGFIEAFYRAVMNIRERNLF